MSDDPLTPPAAQADDIISSLDSPSAASAPGVSTSQWPAPLRYGMGIVLISICVTGLLLILPLLQLILLSFLIAFLMFLPSRGLSRRTRLPYSLCVLLSFVIAAAIVVSLSLLLLPDLRQLLGGIKSSAQQLYTYLATNNATSAFEVLVPPDVTVLLTDIAHLAFGVFGNLAGLTAAVGTASVVALFFLIDLPITGGTMTKSIPVGYQREIALLFDKLDRLWLKFFRALLIIGAVTAAANFATFTLFGIPGAALLAVATATIGLIPVVGRILSILIIFGVALANGSTTFTSLDPLAFATLTLVVYLIVTQVINSIISPKLKGSAINVPTVAIVIGVMVGLVTAGVVGALLITPILGSLRVFINYTVAKILLHDPYPGELMPALQGEGFFSHMIYVKKKEAANNEA